MEAVQKIVTTRILAKVLRVLTSLLKSRVQLLMTGANATMGMALKAETMVNPPAPHLGKMVAITAMP